MRDHRTGSIPVLGTIVSVSYAPVAQLDRAFDYGSKGYGFDSYRARYITLREVAQLGRALGLGPRGRRFKSCLPDFCKITWGLSSAGRAPALHAGGQRFDPASLHHLNLILIQLHKAA